VPSASLYAEEVSMNEQVKLLVDILEEGAKEAKVRSEMFDGTEFTIMIPKWKIDKIEHKEKNRGWIVVESHGQGEDNKVSITLPHPILNVGHRVAVDIRRVKNF
jgi:hypothetical protein